MKAALNWLLLVSETAGALTILWHGVPIYRRLLMGVTQRAETIVIFWVSAAVVLIQVGYWFRLGCFPSPQFDRHVLLGHAIQFLGRLSFVFIGGMFSVVYFARFHELEFSLWRVSMLLAALFSMFCYAMELDRLGRAFCEGHAKPT